jgi:hypothetical protein
VNLFRAHPVFSTVLIAFVAVIGIEIWWVTAGRREERELERLLDLRIGEIDRLQRQKPAPTDENLRRAREDFAQNAVVLATMLRALNVVGPDELDYFKGEPASRTDAYFDIAQFVDRMRGLAAQNDVVVRPEERFGFSAYSNEGPEPDLIRPVYRQRRIVEYLLRELFAARPRSLVAVQREEPVAPGSDATGRAAARSTPSPGSAAVGNIFTIDPQVSARTPGYVDTLAFRISFTGQTAALRGFVNALAAPEIPLVVRSVEVEPNVAESGRGSGSSAGGTPPSLFSRSTPAAVAPDALPANVPIVAENDSRFTVTVELFEVKIRAPEVGNGGT